MEVVSLWWTAADLPDQVMSEAATLSSVVGAVVFVECAVGCVKAVRVVLTEVQGMVGERLVAKPL